MTQQIPNEVPVLIGAAEELVTHRELRNKYQTNRSIKTWSVWFLLKALTKSGKLQQWRKQLTFLLSWLQCNERTLYSRLHEMEALELISIDEKGNINLISYEKAAAILDIPWCGTKSVPYNPSKYEGNQIFQYLLRAEEFRYQQNRQLEALTYHLDNNPSLKNNLHVLLVQQGADSQRLFKDPRYYQQRLLQLQLQLFKEGSEILAYVCTHRADINRGVAAIQNNHGYKSAQSASYLKKRMFQLGVIRVEKICVESKVRSRLYVPVAAANKEGRRDRDGYKWISATKRTALFLTDQITFAYEMPDEKRGETKGAKAA